MTRVLLSLLVAAPAVAQVPYSYPSPYGPIPGPQSYAPNVYNRGSQPLSPYLNLGNTFNPAASYYYGVRPGTLGPNALGPVYGSGAPPRLPLTARTFLPPAAVPGSTAPPDDTTPRPALPSPGGPVTYGNVFGSSSTGVGGANSPRGFFGSGANPTAGGTPGSIPKVR